MAFSSEALLRLKSGSMFEWLCAYGVFRTSNPLLIGERVTVLCRLGCEALMGLLNLSLLLLAPLLLLLFIKYSLIALSSLSAALSVAILRGSY